MSIRKRFDYATELRAFAQEVDDLMLANRRDPEKPIVSKIDLAQRMRARADEVMRRDDPVERGEFRASDVFAERPGRPARPVRVAVLRTRAGGTITLAKAA